MASSSPPTFTYNPDVAAFASGLGEAVAYLLIEGCFLTIIVLLSIALVCFTTSRHWRSPLYITGGITLFIGLAQGLWGVSTTILDILDPYGGISPANAIGYSALEALALFSADLVLSFRVLVIYPPSRLHKVQTMVIFGPLIALKVIRVVLLILFAVKSPYTSGRSKQWSVTSTYITSDGVTFAITLGSFIVMAMDNLYCSALFLWKLRNSFSFSSSDAGRVTNGTGGSWASRIRTLFWVAATNFILPMPLYTAVVVLVAMGSTRAYPIVVVVTSYVSVVCAIFAMVWSSSLSWRSQSASNQPSSTAGTLRFNRPPHTSTTEGDTANDPDVQLADLNLGIVKDSRNSEGRIGGDVERGLKVRVDWTQNVATN